MDVSAPTTAAFEDVAAPIEEPPQSVAGEATLGAAGVEEDQGRPGAPFKDAGDAASAMPAFFQVHGREKKKEKKREEEEEIEEVRSQRRWLRENLVNLEGEDEEDEGGDEGTSRKRPRGQDRKIVEEARIVTEPRRRKPVVPYEPEAPPPRRWREDPGAGPSRPAEPVRGGGEGVSVPPLGAGKPPKRQKIRRVETQGAEGGQAEGGPADVTSGPDQLPAAGEEGEQ